MRKTALLIFGLIACILAPSHTLAQSDIAHEGIATSGLCGLASIGLPSCPTRIATSATGGYAYTSSTGTIPGAHHRVQGTLAIGAVPLSWLALALRFDGRFDLHPPDALGRDRTGTGDPRFVVRVGGALSRRLSLGTETVVWAPGDRAPSFKARATSIDLKLLAAYDAARWPIAFAGHAGARFDNSANSSPNLTLLRPGDRVALNLSDSHAVLLALGASSRVIAHSELFAELSLDWLVGPKAPKMRESPMRATLGARRFFPHHLQAELTATAALNRAPHVLAAGPLIPVEPRFGLQIGLRHGVTLYEPPPPPPPELEQPPSEPTTAQVSGLLADAQGMPLPDVRITLRSATDGSEQLAVTDGDGKYLFAAVPVGSAQFEAIAPGFETSRWELDIHARMAPLNRRELTAKGNTGILRVLTRTFTSEPLQASIEVRTPRGKKVTSGTSDTQGRFELELPPERYIVIVSAPGHRPHRRAVQIERYGVAILNVDMPKRR